MANEFAHQHSLPKLAQSLKPYWSRSPSPTPDEEAEWEECVSSLLEVTSSIALMTDERDIWAVLDRDPFGKVAEVRKVHVMPSFTSRIVRLPALVDTAMRYPGFLFAEKGGYEGVRVAL